MLLAICLGVIGLLCVYCEFFMPGGILAALGALTLVGSVILFAFHVDSALWIFSYSLLLLILGCGLCLLAIQHIKRSGKKNYFFLQKDQTGLSVECLSSNLIGKEGVVVTELKPAGHVRIEEEVYQAVSQGGFVEKNNIIEVCAVKGSHLLVKIKL